MADAKKHVPTLAERVTRLETAAAGAEAATEKRIADRESEKRWRVGLLVSVILTAAGGAVGGFASYITLRSDVAHLTRTVEDHKSIPTHADGQRQLDRVEGAVEAHREMRSNLVQDIDRRLTALEAAERNLR